MTTDHRRPRWKTLLGLGLTGLMLFPLYWMVNVSLTERSAIRTGDLYPKHFTLDHYTLVLHQQLPYIATSIVVGLGTVAVTLVISAPAASALAKLFVPGRRVLTFVLLVVQMVPAVVMALGLYMIYSRLGVLDTIPGLIMADSTISVPFGVMVFTAFMSGIPRDLLQAAEVDGASPWRTFWSVIMPIAKNSTVTVGLFAFLWAWSDFLFASTLDRGGETLRPITMGLYDYIGSQNQEWGPLMATAVLASIPTAILLVVAQRYIAAGVTAGAIKD